MARQQGLDLVEISPTADPPVCRVMDFGKYRYDESRKRRLARKHQHAHVVKEIKFHVNVAEHDYLTKLGHVRAFLAKGHKVKLTLTFRGRENAHRELGVQLMARVLKDCADVSVVDSAPKMMGYSLIGMVGPRAAKSAKPAQPAQVPAGAPVRPAVPVAPPATAPVEAPPQVAGAPG